MRRGGWIGVAVAAAVLASVVTYVVRSASISALPTPGALEASIARSAKNYFIHRAADKALPPPPPRAVAALAQGKALFGMECATCHGQDGRHASAIGGAMYPRAADLGSPRVQRLTDRELFWVIENGIRFTGMPGFARINSDGDNWKLVYYVQGLGSHPAPAGNPRVHR
ncbi:MAG: c-type cytochrome [Terriglobales bacterium]